MIEKDKEHGGLNCTINTTEDCNLRCSYCYEINKKPHSIPIEYAYKFVDLIFDTNVEDILDFSENEDLKLLVKDKLTMDFIGGDSLIDPSIVDEVMQYVLYKSVKTNKFINGIRFSISTNGTLFERKDVRDFCEKWKDCIDIGISIDGCPEIHDKNRIFAERGPNGEKIGTMSTILKWIPWWKSVFPETTTSKTKATCSKESIPYLFESLKFMVENIGLTQINQNFIMEDMHLEHSDLIELCNQMNKCVDYVIDNRHKIYWGMLDKEQFAEHKLSKDNDWNFKGHCGSGAMPCLSIDGKIYPCFRWLPHTQKTSGCMSVGDIFNGWNHSENFKKVRTGAFKCNCTRENKCKICEYESACSYCIGGCYCEHGDFIRTTHICPITKILCEYSKRYWNRYNELEGIEKRYKENSIEDIINEFDKEKY